MDLSSSSLKFFFPPTTPPLLTLVVVVVEHTEETEVDYTPLQSVFDVVRYGHGSRVLVPA